MAVISVMRFQFDDFVVDFGQREVTRAGARIHLSPKAFVLLESLVQERPRVVGKADLQARIWPDVVVEEANLTNLISELRGALDDDPRRPRYIRTSHGFGYAFIAAVREERGEEETENARPRIRPQRLLSRAAIGAMLALVLGGATALLLPRMRTSEASARSSGPREQSGIRIPIEYLWSADISKDGRFIAYSTRHLPRNSIRLRHVDSGNEIDLVPNDEATDLQGVTVSPDGSWVYYLRGTVLPGGTALDRLQRISVLGGAPETVFEKKKGLGGSLALSPDSGRIAFVRLDDEGTSTVVIANADGSDLRDLAQFRNPERLRTMSWSPDGREILATFEGFDPRPASNLAILDAANGRIERRNVSGTKWISALDWMPDGKRLVGVDWGGVPVGVEIDHWQATPLQAGPGTYLRVRPGGEGVALALTHRMHISLWIADLDEPAAVNQITSGDDTLDGLRGLTWSAQNRIIFSAFEWTNESASLWSCDPDGRRRQRLTRAPRFTEHDMVAASPDGSRIVFVEAMWNENGRRRASRIVRARADGSDPLPLTPFGHYDSPFFSTDGQFVFYTEKHDATWRVMRIGVDGGATSIFREGVCSTFWGFDPSGQRFACCLDSVEYVFEQQRSDPSWKRDLPASMLRWTADGNLSYAPPPSQAGNVFVQSLDDGPPRQATRFNAMQIQMFAWSPEGRKLVIARGRPGREAWLLKDFTVPERR